MRRLTKPSARVLIFCAILTLAASSTSAARDDDTRQLQRDVNAALAANKPVILAAREYQVSSTIKFAPQSGHTRLEGVAVRGAGALLTKVFWSGPANQSVFSFTRTNFSTVENFAITGGAALADLDFSGGGSSVGVQLSEIVMDNPAQFSFRAGNPADNSQVSECSLRSVFSYSATKAGFQIDGNNSLNFNFFNCYCSHEPICVSNDPRIDGGSQAGGSFNWFGGGAGATPLGKSDPFAATFLVAGMGNYNFVGARVEGSGTLILTENSTIAVVINWIGGLYENGLEQNRGAKIINYAAGGTFRSTHSLWMADGSFYFGPATQAATFDDDLLRVGAGPNKSPTVDSYFKGIPARVLLRIRKRVHPFP